MRPSIQPVTRKRLGDLGRLFATDATAARCWCMWFIVPVKDFHSAGPEGNRARFSKLAAEDEHPLGLIAYQSDEPVGWVAVGPRSRYVRALKTPTYRGGEAREDSSTWLVPCFFVRREARGSGVTAALLKAAVQIARASGAAAIEGFPFSSAKRRSGGDVQVGFRSVFEACGFRVIRTPSASRVVMRRELNG